MRALLVAVLAVVVAGGDAASVAAGPSTPPAASTAFATDTAPAGITAAGATAADVGTELPPTRLRIPAIGVDSPLVELGVDGGGVLVPPDSAGVAGWFAAGPAPGAAGPALLAGHVDSRTGPGVFLRLRDLQPGARIEVQRSGGSVVVFVVSRLIRTPKSAFPTELVYAPTPGPELRLVTCGGSFDRAAGSYLDNIVVEAVAAEQDPWTIGP